MAKQPLLIFDKISLFREEKKILSELSFDANQGDFIVLTGPTGSGKSSVLKLIAGLTLPSAGNILLANEETQKFSDVQRRWLRRSIGFIPQEHLLLNDRNVLDNVMLPALAVGQSISEASKRAKIALKKCGIEQLLEHFPCELSSGQKQLTCLARAVVNRPILILADEPFAHLDHQNAQTLLTLLEMFASGGVTVIVASNQKIQPTKVSLRTITLKGLD